MEEKPLKKENKIDSVANHAPELVGASEIAVKPIGNFSTDNAEQIKTFTIESENDDVFDHPQSRLLARLKVLDVIGRAKTKKVGGVNAGHRTIPPQIHMTPPISKFSGDKGFINYYVYFKAKDGNKGCYVSKNDKGEVLSVNPAVEKMVTETFIMGEKIKVKEIYGVTK